MAWKTCGSRRTWRLAAVMAVAWWTAGPAQAQATAQAATQAQTQAQQAPSGSREAGTAYGVPSAQLAGTYAGAMACNGVPRAFTLTLDGPVAGGGATLVFAAGTAPAAPALRGSYDETKGVLLLQGTGAGAAQRYVAVVRGSGAPLVLHRQDSGVESCTLAVAARGSRLPGDWADIVAAAPAQGPNNGLAPRGPAILRAPGKLAQLFSSDDCTPALLEWLADADRLAAERGGVPPQALLRLMFADAAFTPRFGKPFRQLSEGDREQLHRRMGKCAAHPDFRSRAQRLPGAVLSAFVDMTHFSHFEKNAAALSLGELRRWADEFRTQTQRGSTAGMDPSLPEATLAAAAPLLAQLWPAERQALLADAQAAKPALALAWMGRRLDSGLAAPPADADGWEALAGSLARDHAVHPYVAAADLRPLQGRLGVAASRAAPALVDAAAARATADAAAIEALSNWPDRHPQLWARVDPDTQAAQRAKLDARRAQLIGELVESRRRGFAERIAAPRGLQALVAAVGAEAALASELAPFERDARVAAFAQERSAARAALRERHGEAVISEIGRATATSQLDELERSTLAVGDAATPGGRKVQDALAARRSVLLARQAEADRQAQAAEDARRAAQAEESRIVAERERANAARLLEASAARDAAARADPVAECDRLAAHPQDDTRPAGVAGVAFGRIDAARAVPACAAAVVARKADPRTAFQYSRALWKAGRLPEAIAACRSAADGGHGVAAVDIAYALLTGDGLPRDINEGTRLLMAAAVRGVPAAQLGLARVYLQGNAALQKDDRRAFEWFGRAARNGVREANYGLAVMLWNGDGTARNRGEAMRVAGQLLRDLEPDAQHEPELLQATRQLHADMTGRQAAGNRDDARQRERMDESERRLNEVLREQYNDASRSGWR